MTRPDPVQNPSSSCWSYFLFFIFKLCGRRCPDTSNNWSLSASGGPPTLEIQKKKTYLLSASVGPTCSNFY